MYHSDNKSHNLMYLIVIAVLISAMFTTDYIRSENKAKPIFCFPIETNELGGGTYYGIFYKIKVTVRREDGLRKVIGSEIKPWFFSFDEVKDGTN